MGQVGTFDPAEVDVVVDDFIITGFGDATDAIAYARTSDAISLTEGTDGDSIFVISNKRGGTITLRLLQSSISNDTLSIIANAVELGVAVPSVISVRDNNGNSLAISNKAFIQKMPDSAFGNDANNREWVFLCADLDIFIGGIE